MSLGQDSPGRDLKSRYFAVGGAMIFGLFVLVVQTYRLEITRYEEFAAKSEANFVKDVRLRADRGTIRDANGEILVDQRPSFDLFVTPAFCDRCNAEVLPRLAAYLKQSGGELDVTAAQALIARGHRDAPFVPVPVKIDLLRDEVDVLSAHARELPGVEWVAVPHRNYHTGTVLSHLLGYMNEITQDELDKMVRTGRTGYYLGDFIGRRGLERYFESVIKGKDGSRKEVVNARGETIPELADLVRGEVTQPVPGNNLVLSIDMRLQAEAERAFPGVAGAVVAIEAKTGFIKAIVSRPGFDPNLLTGRISPAQLAALSKDPLQPMIFRPTQQQYSPGSTFKMITALAALRAGKLTASTVINCPGGYRVGGRVWRCDLERGHGPLQLHEALQRSCDVFFYRLGDVLGIEPIADMAHLFGLGSRTGIDVVAEVPGVMPDEAFYNRVSRIGYTKGMALNTAIGQGDDNVTPLQLAMAYSALANGGTLYQPQIVTRIETPDGQELQRFVPKVRGQLHLDPEHRKLIVEALKAVVNEPGGTGSAARLKDVLVAGKTGTAQVTALGAVRLKASQVSYWMRDNAWFAAFAPADDPELVVVVLNEHAGFGASGAAPTAGRVLEKYFELQRLDRGEVVASATPAPPASADVPRAPGAPEATSPVVVDAAKAAEIAALRAQTEVTPPPASILESAAEPPEEPAVQAAVVPVSATEPRAAEPSTAKEEEAPAEEEGAPPGEVEVSEAPREVAAPDAPKPQAAGRDAPPVPPPEQAKAPPSAQANVAP